MYLCLNKYLFIATDKLHIVNFKDYFSEGIIIESNDIYAFYVKIDPEVKRTTLNWRIYTLVQSGIIHRIGRGKFVVGKGTDYNPELSSKIITVHSELTKHYPFLNICLWNTSILNEFMIHQPGKFFTLIECDKDAMDSVFYFLKDHKYSAFLEPTTDIINKYILENKEAVIVKSLVTESPCQIIKGITTVTLEKILVDIFCDDKIFAAQQGSELNNIFKSAYEKYSINENRVLRYAARRGKKEGMKNYLQTISKNRQKNDIAAKI